MSKINDIIQPQGFEIVKHRIAQILTTELENQKSLQNFIYPINVYVDRMTPIDKSEVLAINVRLDGLNKSNHSQYKTDDNVNYSIDVWAITKQDSNTLGDEISTNLRDKFAGMIVQILQSNLYATLSFEPGLILSSNVEGLDTYEASNNQDSKYVSMTRVNHSVRLHQDYKIWQGLPLVNNLTDVKLDLTEKGYKYQLTT